MSEILKKLEARIKKNEAKKHSARPMPQRPRLIEIWFSREKPLCLAIRGIVGLLDHKLELIHLQRHEPKPLVEGEKPTYAV